MEGDFRRFQAISDDLNQKLVSSSVKVFERSLDPDGQVANRQYRYQSQQEHSLTPAFCLVKLFQLEATNIKRRVLDYDAVVTMTHPMYESAHPRFEMFFSRNQVSKVFFIRPSESLESSESEPPGSSSKSAAMKPIRRGLRHPEFSGFSYH